MKDANGRTLQVGQLVSCTDKDGNVRKGMIAHLEFPKSPPRCSGDNGDVLIKCDNGEEVWTVPSDVVLLLVDINDKEITVGCRVHCDTGFLRGGTVFDGVVSEIDLDECDVLGRIVDTSTVLVKRDDGTEEWVSVDDVEVQ